VGIGGRKRHEQASAEPLSSTKCHLRGGTVGARLVFPQGKNDREVGEIGRDEETVGRDVGGGRQGRRSLEISG